MLSYLHGSCYAVVVYHHGGLNLGKRGFHKLHIHNRSHNLDNFSCLHFPLLKKYSLEPVRTPNNCNFAADFWKKNGKY